MGEEDDIEGVGEEGLAHVAEGEAGMEVEGVGLDLEAVEHGGGGVEASDADAAFEEVEEDVAGAAA